MTNIAKNLNILMKDRGLNTMELSNRTSIPQPTLHKIITGRSQRPRLATLEKIAKYFDIKVKELTLSQKELKSIPNYTIPLLKWDFIKKWISNENVEIHNYLPIVRKVSAKAFATKSNDAVIPQFKNGATLIFDPETSPRDGSIVLIQLEDYTGLLLRNLIIDVNQSFIKSLNPDLADRLSPISTNDKILATLIQVIIDYENN